MNQSPMIHAPSKKTDEVDWATPLKRYIHTTYQEDPEKYADECMTIHRLRQDMRGAGKDLTGRDLLYRYYGQLELLDLRFPVDESHIRISFTWYDAFTLKTTSQFSLAYEKASTIFNIAAVLSAIAASQNRFESDGLKHSSTYFQASAGMYAYINDNFLHAPSTDLSREVVKLLSQLMLTQAQECFLEKSIGAKKTSSVLIAKLAAQAGWSYGNIVENMTEFVNKSIFDKSWLSVCQIKHKYISSVSQYQKALACEAELQYGECVARLNVADTLAKEATKLANSFVSSFSPSSTQTLMPDAASSLQELTKANAALIAEKKKSATHDNDIIYNDAVPQESVLTPIDKINAVKPISIQELYNANEIKKVIGPDMFQRLIPYSVHESASLYSEEKAKIVRGETERCDSANTELETSLIDMKLPGMLEKFKSTGSTKSLDELATPTPEVCEWADRVRDEEINKIPINVLQSTVEDLKNKVTQMLDEISHILDAEQRACEEMRVKYGDEWTQVTSGSLTLPILKDLRKHRESLDQAGTSDRRFTQILDQYMNDISILNDGANGDRLETAFAEALASMSNDTPAVNGKRADNILDIDNVQSEESMSSKVRQIEECIGNLNKVRKERMDTLSDLKEKTHQDDISHLLILNKKTQNIEPQLFATELEKFVPYKLRITASIHQQQKLLHQLNALYKSLMEGEEARAVQNQWELAERKRKEVVERFRKAKDTYFEVKEGFTKGHEWYDDLSDSIKNLLKTTRNFADDRQNERNDLVRAITDRQQQKLREDLRHSSA
ncbi:5826_t:CDS:2, partial [Paraglomus occultum]